MALIAWYPLNGDILDYSGNENHATNYGATIDVNGKIGKCYSFDGIDDGIATPWKPTEFFTLGMWFYKSDWGTDGYENLIGAYSTTFELHTKVSTTNEPYLKLYSWGGATVAYELNRWNHVLLVRTPSGTKLYLNGELKITGSAGSLPNEQYYIGCWRNNTVQNFKGKINDVRFYDHALSQKEIKELAKAKILHYTFDDFQEPTENLTRDPLVISNIPNNGSGGTFGEWSFATWTGFNHEVVQGAYGNAIKITGNSNITGGNDMWNSGWRDNIIVGKTYNFSFYAKGSGIIYFRTRWGFAEGIQLSDLLTRYTFTTTNTGTQNSNNYFWLVFGGMKTEEWCIIEKFQLEEKDHPTPFTPASRQGIVKDISGYRNDAALDSATSPQWIEESKIGSGAYKFNGNNLIDLGDSFKLGLKDMSWVFWAKPEEVIKSSGYVFSKSFAGGQIGRYFANFMNNKFRMCFSWTSGHSEYYSNSQVRINEWVHVGISLNRNGNLNIYINGNLDAYYDISIYKDIDMVTSNPFRIGSYTGANGMASTSLFIGLIDDVRIYATALSQQDIEELYKTRASIDDGGNLYAAQILENTEPAENLIHFQNPRIDASYDPYIPTTSGTWAAKHPDAIKVYNKDGTQITGYIDTGVTDWTNTYHAVWTYDESLKKPVVTMRDLDGIWKAKSFGLGKSMDTLGLKAGDKYTISWLQWTDNISRYVNAGLYGLNTSGANGFWDGQSNAQTTCKNTLPKTWQRVYATFTVNANRNMSANLTMFMYGHGSPAATIKISDVQMEKLDHPTPFVDKLRLQSTDIPNNHIYKNTVESNGCLGYENISEIGITNGLVAYYPFDKDAKDYSGYANHGTVSGAVATVGGVEGNAKLFKAVGDKMAINSISGDVLTLCAWHKWDTASTNWRTLFGNTGNYHHLIFNNDRSLNIRDGAQRKFSYSVPDNGWHHYVVVINSGVNASLYVDGVFNSTIVTTLNLKTYPVQFIGNWGGNNYPCGTLDEVRIYDRPLAAEEVAILYDTTRPDKPSVKLTKDMLYLSGELKEGL